MTRCVVTFSAPAFALGSLHVTDERSDALDDVFDFTQARCGTSPSKRPERSLSFSRRICRNAAHIRKTPRNATRERSARDELPGMRIMAAVTFMAALGATGSATTVTVAPSSIGFKQAMAACPGALAAVSFTLGHVRIAELPGVSSDLDDTVPTAQTIALTSASGNANVTVNAKTRQVSANNVKLSGKTVACIGHD